MASPVGGYYQHIHPQQQGMQPIQQQQYSLIGQHQPQNIYQQLGKPQPPPHLQSRAQAQMRTPTYGGQSQKRQPMQSSGFQFAPSPQPQQYTPPLQPQQGEYIPTHTTNPNPNGNFNNLNLNKQQIAYLPSQTPFGSQLQAQAQQVQQQQQPYYQVPAYQQAPFSPLHNNFSSSRSSSSNMPPYQPQQ